MITSKSNVYGCKAWKNPRTRLWLAQPGPCMRTTLRSAVISKYRNGMLSNKRQLTSLSTRDSYMRIVNFLYLFLLIAAPPSVSTEAGSFQQHLSHTLRADPGRSRRAIQDNSARPRRSLNSTLGWGFPGFEEAYLQKFYAGPVCAFIDARNSPDNLKDLENCVVVNGYVHIVFMHNAKDSDYEKYTFPKLQVITEYLLIYRVYGLRSLRKMFPNLAVIEGRRVFYKYGMVIYDNAQLQELGLGNLRHIARGGVRIQKNNKLCYLDTVDWSRLAMLGDRMVNKDMDSSFIKDNTIPGDETCLNQCGEESDCLPSAPDNKRHCWGLKLCQKTSCPEECPNACEEGKCICHEECLSGCTASNNASACRACRHKSYDGTCVTDCPPGMYVQNKWRCVTKEWCVDVNWLPHDGECLQYCPPGYSEKHYQEGGIEHFYCDYCGKKCRKVCALHEYVINDKTTLHQVYGCTRIPGRLIINLAGEADLLKASEEALQGLEEVGTLVIRRSESLVSLSILKNLKRITGARSALKDDTYSLYVLNNENLRELFVTSNTSDVAISERKKSKKKNRNRKKGRNGSTEGHPLTIEGGKAFFHFNPRLCMKEIEKVSALTEEVEDDKDISEITNGDRTTCDMMPLKIKKIEQMPEEMGGNNLATLRITWKEVEISNPRTLIGYQVFYKESKFKNATRFEVVYACGNSQSWLIKDKLVNPNQARLENASRVIDAVLYDLKAFTQYAIYVRTYTTSTARKGAQSDIIYYTTEPSRPSEPLQLRARPVNMTAIYVGWKPPLSPNGIITHYVVRWRRQREHMDVVRTVDFCKDQGSYPSKMHEPIFPEVVPTASSAHSNNGKGCCSCERKEILPEHEEEAKNNLNFENFLHKSIFRVRYFPVQESSRRRRSYTDPGDIIERYRREFPSPNITSIGNITTNFIQSSTIYPTTTGDQVTATRTPAPSSSPEDPEFQWNSAKTKFTNLTLGNLHHFSEYEIQVFACNNASRLPLSPTHGELNPLDCSFESITANRTLPLPGADVIPDKSIHTMEVNVYSKSGDVEKWPALKWTPPPDPNGYVKLYKIDVQRRYDDGYRVADEPCYSLEKFEKHKGVYPLSIGLASGLYRGRVMPVTLAGKGEWTKFITFEIPDQTPGPTNEDSEKNILIAAMIGGLSFVILSLIVLWYCFKKRNADSKNAMIYSSANPEYISLAANYIPDGYEVDEEDVELLREIGHGNFGKVYVGNAKKVIKGEEKTQVAIKKLHEKSSIHKRMEFLEEAKLMKAFNSTHVVRLLGVVSQTADPMVIMEYMEKGDLKSYLRSRRDDADVEREKRTPPPALQEKLQMAAEIADGMAYLSDIKYVHRDLAARNCLVSSGGIVKIGDFGLTRDIYETDYYRKDSRGLLPIRWMAPESLKDGVFDSRSDVWAYGVVLWEIATLAEQPYQGLPHDQVTRYVIDGGYMEKPGDCPKKLYDLMLNCWQFTATMRPTFMEVLAVLSADVNDRFREESFYYEQRRIKPEDFKTDEETALLIGMEALLRGEGSSRTGTPLNTTPTRSRCDTPCGCHTPASRNSNASSKIGNPNENVTTNIDAPTFHGYTPNGVIGGQVHPASLDTGLPRRGSGHLWKTGSFSQRGHHPPVHLKKTPPDTLTRRKEDFYYSLSSSGLGAELDDETSVEGESFGDLARAPAQDSPTQKAATDRHGQDKDISYASLSMSATANPRKNALLNTSAKVDDNQPPSEDKPYAHMNGFVKRNDSQTKRSPKHNSSRNSPICDESSYVDTSPQYNPKYFESNARSNHFLPSWTSVPVPPPSPPSTPPPVPPPVKIQTPTV